MVNVARQKSQQDRLKPDDELRAWLANRSKKTRSRILPAFTESVQAKFPRYCRLAVCTLQSLSVEDLLQKASDWSAHTEKSFTHHAVVARTRPARLGFECVIVTGRRLAGFSAPKNSRRGHDNFYITCPLCHQRPGLRSSAA